MIYIMSNFLSQPSWLLHFPLQFKEPSVPFEHLRNSSLAALFHHILLKLYLKISKEIFFKHEDALPRLEARQSAGQGRNGFWGSPSRHEAYNLLQRGFFESGQ